MKILFLGTGTSTGVPQIGCQCAVCQSADSKDKRLRASVLLTEGEHNLLIDCGPDFRQQMLSNNIPHINDILLTHEHYDHVSGLDEIRPMRLANVYAEKNVLEAVEYNMPYFFNANPYPGAPKINLHEITSLNIPFQVADFQVQPIRLLHFDLAVLGYRVGDFAYLTDFSSIEEVECSKLQGLQVLVVDALRQYPHHGHLMLSEALALVKKLQPERAYFTHMSHEMGLHAEVQQLLPANVFFAWDGLEITV